MVKGDAHFAFHVALVNDHAQGRGATMAKLKNNNGYSRVDWSSLLTPLVFFII
jgi:hypothetical protein